MLNKLTRGLFIIILIELILGGGRLINFGSISLRMILFAFALILTAFHLLRGSRIDRKYLFLLLIFSVMLGIGIAVGLVTRAEKKLLWEDVKPLMYFYMLPFFVLAISKLNDLKRISQIIIISTSLMAFVFVTILVLIATDVIPYIHFYPVAFPTGEFFFRGEYTFFYKGFLYLCIGLIFVHLLHGKNYWWLLALLSLAILLSFTRGLIFALGLTYAIYYLSRKQLARAILASLICGLVLFLGKDIYGSISEHLYKIKEDKNISSAEKNDGQPAPILPDKLLGDREFSDNQRKIQIRQVMESGTWESFVWGHGFGNGVESRPVHMEIAYLEIFHKQGVIGLACWFLIFLGLVRSYKNTLPVPSELSAAFFLSALFVFFQSLTNQYVNNPIGMGMVLISLVCLDIIAKESGKEKVDFQ